MTLIPTIKNYLRPWVTALRNLRIAVVRLEGEGRGGPAVALVAGNGGVTVDLLTRYLFPGTFRRVELGSYAVWRIGSVVQRLGAEADITMIRVHRLLARRFLGSDCLRIPDSVGIWLPMPHDLESLFHSNHSLKQDIRVIHKNKIEMSISRDPADFDAFYRDVYLPYIGQRHGERAVAGNEQWLRGRFRDGGILFSVLGGERVAGVVFDISGGVLHFRALGAKSSDPSLLKTGAVSALYYFAILHAEENHCSGIHFGACRAYLNDPILRFKRKWGAEIRVDESSQWDLQIRWPAWNRTVADFLEDTAILDERKNRLRAVTATGAIRPGGEAILHIRKALDIAGLDSMVIVSETGWDEGAVAPPGTILWSGRPQAGELTAA